MHSYRNEINQLKKKILESTIHIQNLKSERKIIQTQLDTLNDNYEDGAISYAEYNNSRNNMLDGKSLDYGIEYYSEAINICLEEIGLYKKRISEIKDRTRKQAIAFAAAIGFMLMFGMLLSTPLIDGITGFVSVNATVESSANITVYIATQLSQNISNGINFTFPANPIGSMLNNATHNYDGAGSATTMWLYLHPDSNVLVDINTNATIFASDTGRFLDQSNLHMSNASVNSATLPSPSNTIDYSTSEQEITKAMAPGESVYFRFWLDVPQGTGSGVYNNTLYFRTFQTT